MKRWLLSVVAGLLAVASPAAAQFNQYTPPGEFDVLRESTAERLETAMQDAIWRLGPVYLDPWLGLRDISYIDNVSGAPEGEPKQSDVTAKIGAGIRGYVPVGSEVTFAFHLLPEYVWWADLSGRNRLNGHYGGGFFADLGRTGFELTATRVEDSIFFSREIEQPVNTRDDELAGQIEFEIGAGFTLFVGGYDRTLRFEDDVDDPALSDVSQLDRDEQVWRGGLQVDLGKGFEIGAGVESSDVEFLPSGADRSNDGISPILQLGYEGDVFFFSLDLAFRDLKPKDGSLFVPYDGTTGKLRFSYSPTGRTELQLFSDRNLVYSRSERWIYFQDTGLGGAVLTSLGPSASIRLFYQLGTNKYTSPLGVIDERTDDYNAWGASLQFAIGRTILTVGGRRTSFVSNLPQFDRTVTVIRSGITLGRRGGFPWT